MNMICSLITAVSLIAIRLFPFAVVFCLLYFPAFKGVMLGYVPVTAGAAFALFVLWKRVAIEDRLSRCSRQTIRFLLYGLPTIIQLTIILVMQPTPNFDGLFVIQHAQNFLTTGNMDPMTYYPPAQTWWYAAWFYFFGASALVAQISHIPLSLGITWGTRRLARDFMPESGARLAALTVAWYPSFIGYVLTTPYYHYLYTFLTIVMVWAALRFSRGGFRMENLPWIFLSGLAAGLGALTKGTQLIAPLQIAIWMIIVCAVKRIFPFKQLIAGAAFFLAGLMMVLSPWIVRNWLVFDDFVPVCTSGGLVLYSANNPESNGLYSPVPDNVEIETPQDMLAHARQSTDQAKEYIVSDPRSFVNLAGFKFLHTWGVEATFVELINYRGENSERLKGLLSFLFLAGWSFVVMLWLYQVLKQAFGRMPLTSVEHLVGVTILSNALVYVVFEGGDRHHLAFVPLIVVGALYATRSNDQHKET